MDLLGVAHVEHYEEDWEAEYDAAQGVCDKVRDYDIGGLVLPLHGGDADQSHDTDLEVAFKDVSEGDTPEEVLPQPLIGLQHGPVAIHQQR